jgi:DNA repair protein RecO (recombination protein O)
MNFVAAQGLVLGATAYSEADKIVQLYTLQLGRVRAIVKGIRKPKSKLASSIDLFTESTFSLHKKAIWIALCFGTGQNFERLRGS